MADVIRNATFSDAECAPADDDGVTLVSEIAVLPALVAQNDSPLSHVQDLLVASVSSGEFTALIQAYASRRRLAED